MKSRLTIAIIGCGTAGLAAAIALAQDNHDVQIIQLKSYHKCVS